MDRDRPDRDVRIGNVVSTMTREDGFTLSELIIVTILLGFVLAAAYAGAQVMQKGADISDQQSFVANETDEPLLQIERVAQQNLAISQVTPTHYSVTFKTDRDDDGVFDWETYTATTGGRLLWTLKRGNNPSSLTTVFSDQVVSRYNNNYSQGIPLFRFYGPSGLGTDHEYTDAQLTSTSSPMDWDGDIDRIVVTVSSSNGSVQGMDSRTVYFRNRQTPGT